MLARIADKHGLTNKYRPIGSKRVVRRGRPRKYLFGPPNRRKKKKIYLKPKNVTNSLPTYPISYVEPDVEINLCPLCNGRHVEQEGNVYVCQNCRATYRSVEELNKIKLGNNSPNTKNTTGCLGCGTFVLIVFVIFCIIIGTSSDDSSSNSATSSIQSVEMSNNGEIDLTAFDGECGVSGRIELEREFDSHLMETVTYVNNNSGKNISKVTLYMVHCYDGASPIDSWKYADRLNVENISVGTSKRTEWLLGTTTYGKKDFKAYIGYVLYEDGTEWGKETIDHKAVVTKNATIEVIFEEVEKFSWKE